MTKAYVVCSDGYVRYRDVPEWRVDGRWAGGAFSTKERALEKALQDAKATLIWTTAQYERAKAELERSKRVFESTSQRVTDAQRRLDKERGVR